MRRQSLLRAWRTRRSNAGEHQVKTIWLILAATGGVLAVVFVFRGDYEKAFMAAAGGAVCWFLNYRVQLKERLASRDEENDEDEESDEEIRS